MAVQLILVQFVEVRILVGQQVEAVSKINETASFVLSIDSLVSTDFEFRLAPPSAPVDLL